MPSFINSEDIPRFILWISIGIISTLSIFVVPSLFCDKCWDNFGRVLLRISGVLLLVKCQCFLEFQDISSL